MKLAEKQSSFIFMTVFPVVLFIAMDRLALSNIMADWHLVIDGIAFYVTLALLIAHLILTIVLLLQYKIYRYIWAIFASLSSLFALFMQFT